LVIVNAQRMHALPLQAWACDHSHYRGTDTDLPSLHDLATRAVIRAGFPLVNRRVNQRASAAAAQLLQTRAEAEIQPRLETAEAFRQEVLRDIIDRYRFHLEEIFFSTTVNELCLNILPSISAPVDCPPTGASDVSLRMHESMGREVAQRVLQGRTLSWKEMDELAQPLRRYVGFRPPQLEDADRWSIRFAQEEAVTLTIEDGVLELTLRGEEYQTISRKIPAMNITTKYRPKPVPEGVRLVREQFEIYPPGYVPGSGRQLSLREVSWRAVLQQRFSRVFLPELTVSLTELPGPFRAAGRVVVTDVSARQGWLIVNASLAERGR
jgi:hypothetical protein